MSVCKPIKTKLLFYIKFIPLFRKIHLKQNAMEKKLNVGIIGGSTGSFIGIVHRMAVELDGEARVVCGAFSSDPQRSKATGEAWYIAPERSYANYREMFEEEQKRPDNDRMDFVIITTPNHLHYEPARLALENGFHVVCEKPMTFNLEEACELVRLVEQTGLLFALTHPNTAYPLVKQARDMVTRGELGSIRKVVIEYPQGWLATALESTKHKQADWRTDPKRSGKSGTMADLGTHAENLVEYITGLRIKELCADLTTFVEGRKLDDDGNLLIHYDNGARGILYASQISAGEENNIRIRLYGEKGGLEWAQQEPNSLIVRWLDKPMQIYRAGDANNLCNRAQYNTRLPKGHPEGLIEAFANIYRNFSRSVKAIKNNENPKAGDLDFPTVYDGLRGMQFIETVVASARSTKKWTTFINTN